jgi:glycosyltransferase involved in cell wall biosynthesis
LKPTDPRGPKFRLVHHGAAQANRNLEAIIEGCGAVKDKCELHLYLVEDEKDRRYYQKIIKLASNFENIFLHKPVPLTKVVGELNQYDLGVYMLKPVDKQTAFALPNKIFEFIQARLGVVVSDLPAMKDVVNEYDLGRVAKGYDAGTLSSVLEELTIDDIMRFKKNSDAAALHYCAENFKEHFLSILEEIQR